MRSRFRWVWVFVLSGILIASTAGWSVAARSGRMAPTVVRPRSAETWSARADAPFSNRSQPESVASGPEEESVSVPLKDGCGTGVLLSALRPPLALLALVQGVSDESVEALNWAWDAYYGGAWRRLYTHMHVHPFVGSVSFDAVRSSEFQTAHLRSYRHPFRRTPVPPRFRGQIPYYYDRYYYRYGYPYGYYYAPWPFYYRYYWYRYPFFYPFYPLYHFYFFYGYPFWWGWGFSGTWWDRPVPPEERRARSEWGEVWFDVQPEDALIYVDGQLWGRAEDLNGWWRSRRIRAGTHRIRIEHEKYPPREVSVQVPPGEAVSVRVDLRQADIRPTGGPDEAWPPTSDRRARLRVQVNAARPEFLLNGQPVPAQYDEGSQVWVLEIPYGTHALEIRADGYDPTVQPVRVTSAETVLWVQLTPRGP
ncbi:MAG: carboxypeptidase-like regulatory domain-containing protein [Acidobacteria bacterium]|nr:carboxypeptidase-like regulatory domain-containing protein [Acidobacteriota bacterium]MDW7985290.1 PEGA domain-containing protein [Acidobacteriota bacterium]